VLRVQKEKEDAEKPPEWQDPAFLKDIQVNRQEMKIFYYLQFCSF